MNKILIVVSTIMAIKDAHGENKIIKNIQRSVALEMLQTTVSSTKNTVVATLPLQFLLCKLASVARGKAKDELMQGLALSNDTMVNNFYDKFKVMLYYPLRTDLSYVNKIYLDYNKNINMSFGGNSSTLYGVHVDTVSYNMPKAAVNFINRGIASATYRRVDDVLNASDINNLTSMLLITAGHFKPSWEVPFYSFQTRERPFKLLNNKRVNVPMMMQVDEYQYYDARDYQVLVKLLGNKGCSMTFVRPDYLSIDEILKKLVQFPNTMKDIREKMGFAQLRLSLPRMKIKSEIDFNEFLKKDGIKDIFDSNSTGLNAILKEGINGSNVFVSKVRQKLFIEVDEYGISRAEKETDEHDFRIHPNTPELVFDRPFYFTINFEFWTPFKRSPTEVYELFNGVYYGPQ